MKTAISRFGRVFSLLVGACIAVLSMGHRSIDARDIVLGGVTTEWRFGGGGSLPPAPPNAAVPTAPSLATPQAGGPLLVQLEHAPGRPVIRSRSGELLPLRPIDRSGRLWVAMVPAEGALLDVLGTDVVGLPVVPGAVLRIVAP